MYTKCEKYKVLRTVCYIRYITFQIQRHKVRDCEVLWTQHVAHQSITAVTAGGKTILFNFTVFFDLFNE